MQFDQMFYNNLMTAAQAVLSANLNRFGQQFAQWFVTNYSPTSMNPQTTQNAQHFYMNVAQYIAQQNNGQIPALTHDQLFNVVGPYVSATFDRWAMAMQQQQGGNNYSRPMFSSQPTGGGGSMFSQNGSMNFAPQRPTGAGAHLADAEPVSRPTPAGQTAAPAAGPTMVPIAPLAPAVVYAANPLDDIPETGIEFVPNEANDSWGGDKPKDNRIVLGKRTDIKTRDGRFTVHGANVYHQQILDDPMQAARDFFEVVPDSVLGSVFLYTVNYNHLSILDVPTADFLELRDQCIVARKDDPDTMLHRIILARLKDMKMGSFHSMSNYLVPIVNRALHLAARMADKPDFWVAISDLSDLDELLSSAYQSSLVQHPNGRFALETIVGNALWGALVKQASVMFENKDTIPTNAIQSSPAFPYSMEGVYPNKYAIPTSDAAEKPQFMEKLNDLVLSRKTFLITRRRVVVTNMFGKKVLSDLDKKPKPFNTPLAPVLSLPGITAMPYIDARQFAYNPDRAPAPYVLEDYPSDQFDSYQEDPRGHLEIEVARFKGKEVTLPVDQTIFAVQYGVSPLKYMVSIDALSTIDTERRQNVVILAKRDVPSLHVTN